MTIDQYDLNDAEYTKLFRKNADQVIDLYYRFSNKLAAGYLAIVPEDVKHQLFVNTIYQTNDCAREKHNAELKKKKEKYPESIEPCVSNAELKKEIDSLKTILLDLVQALITAEENKPMEPME